LLFQVKAFIATELLAHLYSGDQVIYLFIYLFYLHLFLSCINISELCRTGCWPLPVTYCYYV